jgi:hypothetical protein
MIWSKTEDGDDGDAPNFRNLRRNPWSRNVLELSTAIQSILPVG